MNKVANLYDSLKKSNDRKGSSYSIHKKLNYNDNNVSNLYEYITCNFDLKDKRNVLDCGCGVGFGTMILAKKIAGNITGISVSPSEIESAGNNAQIEQLSNTKFECKSFDNLDKDKYDAIVAIESIKHSSNLNKSLKSILSSLQSGGEIYIIEDIATTKKSGIAANRLMKDWVLSEMYVKSDYTNSTDSMTWESVDLTHKMNTSLRVIVLLKILATEIKSLVDGVFNIERSNSSIFRGGFYQEWLYMNNKLKYTLLIGKKK